MVSLSPENGINLIIHDYLLSPDSEGTVLCLWAFLEDVLDFNKI